MLNPTITKAHSTAAWCTDAPTLSPPSPIMKLMASMSPNQPFLSDIQEIRRRARQHMEKGAVTEGYQADLETVHRLLNEALATEIVCVLRYKRHQFMASGLEATSV